MSDWNSMTPEEEANLLERMKEADSRISKAEKRERIQELSDALRTIHSDENELKSLRSDLAAALEREARLRDALEMIATCECVGLQCDELHSIARAALAGTTQERE